MKRIAYIGGQKPPPYNCVWGGWNATNNAFLKAFKNDREYFIDMLPREKATNLAVVKEFMRGADVVHVDDTATTANMFKWQLQPDVIGPIARSPVKDYKNWHCPYSKEWFYQAKVVRLNYQEERKNRNDVTLVIHGVDTEFLTPKASDSRNLILWAGQQHRWAKNWQLWQDIQNTPAPDGYKYHTMTAFDVDTYWRTLDNAAVMVCTSRYESFCSCAFEAMSKGVPVVWQSELQGGLWEDAGFRCEYTAKGFNAAIKQALATPEAGQQARKYVTTHCTLKHMRDSYAQVYDKITQRQPQ